MRLLPNLLISYSSAAPAVLPLLLLLLLPLTAFHPVPTLHEIVHAGLKIVGGATLTACACGAVDIICQSCEEIARFHRMSAAIDAVELSPGRTVTTVPATSTPQSSLVDRSGAGRRYGWGPSAGSHGGSSAGSPANSPPAGAARSAAVAHPAPPAHNYAQLPATSPGSSAGSPTERTAFSASVAHPGSHSGSHRTNSGSHFASPV